MIKARSKIDLATQRQYYHALLCSLPQGWNISLNLELSIYTTLQKVSKYEDFYGRNTGKYGPVKTPYLDTFNTVYEILRRLLLKSLLSVCLLFL